MPTTRPVTTYLQFTGPAPTFRDHRRRGVQPRVPYADDTRAGELRLRPGRHSRATAHRRLRDNRSVRARCPITRRHKLNRLAGTIDRWHEGVARPPHHRRRQQRADRSLDLLVEKIRRIGHGYRNFTDYRRRLLLGYGITWTTVATRRVRGRQPASAAWGHQSGGYRVNDRSHQMARRNGPTSVTSEEPHPVACYRTTSAHQAGSGRNGSAGRPVAVVSNRYTIPAVGSARRCSSLQFSVAVVT